MKKAAWHKTRGSNDNQNEKNKVSSTLLSLRLDAQPIESAKTLAPLAGILCKQYRNEDQLLSWCGGWEKESPAGCACLLLLPQPTRPSLTDERGTTQIGPVSTEEVCAQSPAGDRVVITHVSRNSIMVQHTCVHITAVPVLLPGYFEYVYHPVLY